MPAKHLMRYLDSRQRPYKRRKTMGPARITLSQLPASVKPEVKFSDRDVFGVGSSTFGQIQARPDSIASTQGDDGDQMTGSACFLKGIDYSLTLPSTGWNTCRVSVLIPRDPSITPTGLKPNTRYGHREFIVLHDELFSISDRNHCRIKRTLNLKQKWNLSGSTITENNVTVIYNLDSALSGVNHVLRTYFTDP